MFYFIMVNIIGIISRKKYTLEHLIQGDIYYQHSTVIVILKSGGIWCTAPAMVLV